MTASQTGYTFTDGNPTRLLIPKAGLWLLTANLYGDSIHSNLAAPSAGDFSAAAFRSNGLTTSQYSYAHLVWSNTFLVGGYFFSHALTVQARLTAGDYYEIGFMNFNAVADSVFVNGTFGLVYLAA